MPCRISGHNSRNRFLHFAQRKGILALGTIAAIPISPFEIECTDCMRAVIFNRSCAAGRFAAQVLLLLLAIGCNSTSPSSNDQGRTSSRIETGLASYYGRKYQGRITASGEIFDMNDLTAAHRSYPFGATVRVTRLDNNRSVEVRINDRGPFVPGRVIDLSLAAGRRLDIEQVGVTEVKIEILHERRAAVAADSDVHRGPLVPSPRNASNRYL